MLPEPRRSTIQVLYRLNVVIGSARFSAAIEILGDIETRRRPAADALKDWGLSHRFAGSGDRAALAGLVYDMLRRRASARWLMEAETPRATLIGMLALQRGETPESLAGLFNAERFGPEPLTTEEQTALASRKLPAPGHMLLEADKVTKRFGGLVANNAVAMTLKAGEVHALIGPNGAGKSTFFNMISGVDDPTEDLPYPEGPACGDEILDSSDPLLPPRVSILAHRAC